MTLVFMKTKFIEIKIFRSIEAIRTNPKLHKSKKFSNGNNNKIFKKNFEHKVCI